MAIDPNVYSNLQAPGSKLIDPLTVYGKVQDIQAQRQNQQINALKIGAAQKEEAEDNDIMAALQGNIDPATGTPNHKAVISVLSQRNPRAAMRYSAHVATDQLASEEAKVKLRTSYATLSKTELEVEKAKAERLATTALWADTPEKWDMAAKQMGANSMVGQFSEEGRQFLIRQGQTMKDVIASMEPQSSVGKIQRDVNKGLISATTGRAAINKETHIAPVYSGAPGIIPSGTTAPGQAVTLDQIPANVRDMVKAIGEYRMLPTNLGNRDRSIVMSYVAKAYPNFSQGDAQANAKFMNELASQRPATAGGIILSSERMIGHAAELLDLTEKMGNSNNAAGHLVDLVAGKTPFIGKASMSPTVGQWNFVHGKLIAEAQKLVTGGVPGSQELMHDIQNSQFTDPMDKQKALIQSIVDVGLQNTQGIREQRDNLLGVNSPGDSMLSGEALGKVKKIYTAIGREVPNLGSAASGRGYSNTQQANNPKVVTQPTMPTATGPNGQKIAWNGSAWVPVK